jgi:hypothetical protein
MAAATQPDRAPEALPPVRAPFFHVWGPNDGEPLARTTRVYFVTDHGDTFHVLVHLNGQLIDLAEYAPAVRTPLPSLQRVAYDLTLPELTNGWVEVRFSFWSAGFRKLLGSSQSLYRVEQPAIVGPVVSRRAGDGGEDAESEELFLRLVGRNGDARFVVLVGTSPRDLELRPETPHSRDPGTFVLVRGEWSAGSIHDVPLPFVVQSLDGRSGIQQANAWITLWVWHPRRGWNRSAVLPLADLLGRVARGA